MALDENTDINNLTPQQIRLLRLVAAGKSASKELARETNLKESSIDTYLQAACRSLGVDGRKQAAKRLLELELISQLPSQLRNKRLADQRKSAISRIAKGVWQFVTGLPIGGKTHTFSWWRVAAEIFRVALLGAAGVTFLVLIVRGMMRTFS
jgi:DNA-binding CsgD family transcriptional regulator